MAGTISGGINFQGLGSGTDFAAMITKLKSVESIPKQRMEVWKTEWSVRVSAFQEIMTVMQEAKSALAAFSTMDQMLSRTVDSSVSSVATATANSKIEEGVYSINVLSLARSAIFSNRQVFAAKDQKINESGAAQSFNYTYKGVTRELSVANGATLEQLVSMVNNDGANPGVRATLIKSGTGYVFQIQGKDTGAEASLSVESSLSAFDSAPQFSGRQLSINNTGADGTYTYSYKGKQQSIAIPDGMTANEFVAAVNARSGTMGVTASLVQQGSDYVVQMRDAATQQIVTVPASTDVAALGALSGFGAGQVVNSSSTPQLYKYTYQGTEHTLTVAAGATIEQFIAQFNAQANPLGLQGGLDGSGKFQVTVQDAALTASGSPGDPMTLSYTDGDGVDHTINVPDGTTLKGLVGLFNAQAGSSGLHAALEDDGGGNMSFIVRDAGGADVTASLNLGGNITNLSGTALGPMPVALPAATTLAGLGGMSAFSGRALPVNNTGADQTYSFTYGGQTRSFNVPAGTTMDGFVSLFNTSAAGLDITASVRATGSGYEIQMTNAAGQSVRPETVTTGMNLVRGTADNWYVSQATDARFTLNGWDQEFTSASNSLTEVIDGLNITLKGTGETQLVVGTDMAALKENIKSVVDAMNSVRAKIKELTKYDKDKETKNPEIDEASGVLRLASQFTWQKGSVLTGNYGVQLLTTRLQNVTSSRGQGYVPRSDAMDAFNDMFTSLGQIGISTVTDESDPEFGLLRIDDVKLDAALAKDLRGVAELFSANKQAATGSSDFTVASVGTRAKAGVYDVTYDVDPATKQAINVRINGALAHSDSAYPGRWTVGDMNNDAVGLAIQFSGADLDPAGGPYTDTVRIKDGKVNEMIGQLTAELQPVLKNVESQNGEYLNARAGALPLLVDNYQTIMKNIDKKITRETERISQWERRMKLKFSRLDSLLARYNQQMQSDAASFAKLNGGE